MGKVAFSLSAIATRGYRRMAEIKVISTNGVATLLREVAPEFERANGHKLTFVWGPTRKLRDDIDQGATFDVAILTNEVIDELTKAGKVAGARTDIARSGIGVATRAGARKPDISTPEAFKRTLLEAKSVAYSAQGMSGVYFAGLLERLGIAEEVKPKAKIPSGRPTGELAASGEAELAVQQISELLPVSGIEIVGPLPGNLQLFTVFSAGIGANARDKGAAQALIGFLAALKSNPLLKAKGLEPA
jgi:molybdate transport system substrate-binding protein